MSTATINIAPNIYHKIDSLAVKERRSFNDVIKELLELGWRIRINDLDFKWLKMIREAEEDVEFGRLSGPYDDTHQLQEALDDLK